MASPATAPGAVSGKVEDETTDEKAKLSPRSFKTANFNGRNIKKGNILSNIGEAIGKITCIRRDQYKPIS